jgi:LAO/AO transport system kinase
LCEAANFNIIIVETVGVGQSELMVAHITDLFCLLLAPAAGDELQGAKKGIVEIADLIFINKADGDLRPFAEQTKKDFQNALHLSPSRNSIIPELQIKLVSALEKKGIAEAVDFFDSLFMQADFSARKMIKRSKQDESWFSNQSAQLITEIISKNKNFKSIVDELAIKLQTTELDLYEALSELSAIIHEKIKL